MLSVQEIRNRQFSSSSYLLSDEKYNYCWAIDIGEFAPLLEQIPIGKNIRGVFLTHGHFDHIAGINDLVGMYPECRVYTSSFGEKMLRSDALNLSKYHKMPMIYNGQVEVLEDGDIVRLFNDVELSVIATPGHCPSCLTYQIGNHLFTGDSYIPWAPVVTKLRYGDKKEAQKSISKILSLITSNTIVCPGHWGKGCLEL